MEAANPAVPEEETETDSEGETTVDPNARARKILYRFVHDVFQTSGEELLPWITISTSMTSKIQASAGLSTGNTSIATRLNALWTELATKINNATNGTVNLTQQHMDLHIALSGATEVTNVPEALSGRICQAIVEDRDISLPATVIMQRVARHFTGTSDKALLKRCFEVAQSIAPNATLYDKNSGAHALHHMANLVETAPTPTAIDPAAFAHFARQAHIQAAIEVVTRRHRAKMASDALYPHMWSVMACKEMGYEAISEMNADKDNQKALAHAANIWFSMAADLNCQTHEARTQRLKKLADEKDPRGIQTRNWLAEHSVLGKLRTGAIGWGIFYGLSAGTLWALFAFLNKKENRLCHEINTLAHHKKDEFGVLIAPALASTYKSLGKSAKNMAVGRLLKHRDIAELMHKYAVDEKVMKKIIALHKRIRKIRSHKVVAAVFASLLSAGIIGAGLEAKKLHKAHTVLMQPEEV